MQRVDVTGSLVRFGRQLRRAGLGVSVGQLEALLRSFEFLDPLSRAHVYHAARATLVTRYEDLALFDRIFDSFWLGAAPRSRGGTPMPVAPRHRRGADRPALARLLAQRAQASDPSLEVQDRSHTASEEEQLQRRDFATLGPLELAAVQRLLDVQRWDFATRVTRRKVSQKRGRELDLRRVPSRAARSGGVVLELPRRSAKLK